MVQDATLSQTATITSLSFYVDLADGNLRLGIYDATGPGGGPGALMAQTASFTPVVGWNTQNVITPVSLPAGKYWLAYFPSSPSLQFAANFGIGPFVAAWLWFGPMPATFPTNTFAGTEHESLIGTVRNVGYRFVPLKPDDGGRGHPRAGDAARGRDDGQLSGGDRGPLSPSGQMKPRRSSPARADR